MKKQHLPYLDHLDNERSSDDEDNFNDISSCNNEGTFSVNNKNKENTEEESNSFFLNDDNEELMDGLCCSNCRRQQQSSSTHKMIFHSCERRQI